MIATRDTVDLGTLLKRAAAASPNDRIGFRQPIAAHGAAAVPMMAQWLSDQRLGAFAVRVLEVIAAQGVRKDAVAALAEGRWSAGSEGIRSDVENALAGLGVSHGTAPRQPLQTPDLTPELRNALYELLTDAARNERTVTYSDAAPIVGLTMRSPHHRKVLGQILGAISEAEVAAGRPMLSSIVVYKGAKGMGQGFYQLGEELRHKAVGEDEGDFAKRELMRTFEHWATSWDVASGPTRTGAPDYRTRGPQESPPPTLGGCDFSGPTGRCQNPGRWDRDGRLSCTTHALARSPLPFEGGVAQTPVDLPA